ncbi:MAG: hypothetical protein IID16_04775 [Candidatus Marinimicrobia bacterium]|nr:hypothetical protein [Candidatus Neomarinimicrobiota bacterium]
MRKKIGYLLFCIIWISLQSSVNASGVITHQPEIQHPEGEPLIIFALVSSEVEIDDVRLLYRNVEETGYIEVYLTAYGDMWRGEIPGEHLYGDGIQYFIASTLADGSMITFPADEPESSPITVEIQLPVEEPVVEHIDTKMAVILSDGDEQILIFSPAPGSNVPYDDVYIAASLFNIDSIDIASIRITLDNQDVTRSSSVSNNLVTYEPFTMSSGKHTVRIEARTLNNQIVPPATWSFKVIKKREEEVEREFTYSGRINGGYSLDQIEDQTLSISRTTASFSGNWRFLRFKTDAKLTSEEDPFKQPRNRFRFHLDAGRYFSMNLGDFNSRLSRFTLDGKRVRGVDVNLKFGWVNLHVVRGELDRAIQGRLGAGESYVFEGIDPVTDTTTGITEFTYNLNRKGYTFQNDIFAGRLSFGSGKVFQLGFNWLKAKDDIGSAKRILEDARIIIDEDSFGTITPDTLTYVELDEWINSTNNYRLLLPEKDWGGDDPQDNIVIGSDIKLSLFGRKIGMEAGWTFSMLNKDIWDGAMSKDDMDVLLDDTTDGFIGRTYDENGAVDEEGISLDNIPIDPADYEGIFVINENMVPLVPIDPDSTQLKDDPLTAILNMPSLAYNFKVITNLFNNQFTLEYIKVGPEFNSLGNPYIQKNNREYTISDRFRLLENRLFVNLMYRHQDDNILRTVTNVTTTNTLSANVNIFPGPNLPSINLSLRNMTRANGKAVLDTVSIDTTGIVVYDDLRDSTNTFNATVGLSYRVNLFGMNHNISTNFISIKKLDLFSDRDTTFSSPDLSSTVVTISIVTQYSFPLRTTAVISINNSEFGLDGVYGTQGISNFSLNGSYDLLKGKLRAMAGLDLTTGSGNDDFRRFGIRGGFTYRITNTLGFRFDSEFRSKSTNGDSKTSTLLRASLNYSF